ncbi:MAG: hypothetical protein MI921_21640 [Cytophagales bacterium]|nr:hypothetical protein [Cytophagales bacterium]
MSVKIAYLPRRVKDPNDKTGKKKIDCSDGFIYIRYIYKSVPTYFGTGIEVRPDQFNYNKQKLNYLKGLRKDLKRNKDMIEDLQAMQDNDMFLIDAKMTKVKRLISDLKREKIEPTGNAVKRRVQGKVETEQINQKVHELWKEYIKSPIPSGKYKGKRRTESTIKQIWAVYNNMVQYFQIKNIPLKLESFDRQFYDNYTYFMEYDRAKYKDEQDNKLVNMDVATRGNQIAKIKAFLKWVEKNKGYKFDFDLSDLIATRNDKKVVYLSEKELTKLAECDLSDSERLTRVRDLFILHCRIGLRYSDLSRLGTEHINGDTIELKTQKAGTSAFVPLVADAFTVIQKYTKLTDVGHVLELPKISEQKYNDYLKELGGLAEINQLVEEVREIKGNKVYSKIPKHKLLSSHKAVSTFITLSAQRGIPVKTISQITGKSVAVINKHYLGETDKETIVKQMKEGYNEDKNLKVVD